MQLRDWRQFSVAGFGRCFGAVSLGRKLPSSLVRIPIEDGVADD